MKLIIAGGRDYQLTPADYAFLDALHAEHQFTEVVHGDQTGADTCGKHWGIKRGIPHNPFPATPEAKAQYGKRAFPMRNSAMVKYVGKDGMLVAFPGANGTADITQKARRAGLPVVAPGEGRG